MVYVWCPVCLEECKHYVIKEGSSAVVKCNECKNVHSATIGEVKPIDVRVIISVDDLSFKRKITLKPEDLVNVGEEYVIEDEGKDVDEDISGDDGKSVEVTIIELKNGKREKSAKAKDIETIWSRLTDYVILRASIQKKGNTRSIRIGSPGDYDFVVGKKERLDKEFFEISAIKRRDGKVLKRIGDSASAKNVKRIYGRPT